MLSLVQQFFVYNIAADKCQKGFNYYSKRLYSTNVRKWASTNCTSLVPYGTHLGSTIHMGRLSTKIACGENEYIYPMMYILQ